MTRLPLLLLALVVGCSCEVTRAEWYECERVCAPEGALYMVDGSGWPLCGCIDGRAYEIKPQQPAERGADLSKYQLAIDELRIIHDVDRRRP
jgi:hypothetical protein